MFDALSNRLQDVFQSLKGETRLTEATVERVLRRDPPGAARSRRQLQGRQGVRRSRARSGDGSGGPQGPQRRRSRSSRSFAMSCSRCSAMPRAGCRKPRPAARDLDARPAGLGQDHDHRQAREVAREAGPPPDRRLDRRAAPGGDPAAGDRGAAGGRAGARSGRRDGSGGARQGRAGRAAPSATTSSSSTPRAGCTSTTS